MVTLSTYLPTINFKNAVIVALDWEGLSTTDDLLELEEDDLENLFKIIKTPGGEILNLAYIPPGGTPAVVPAIYIPQYIPAIGINVPYLNTKHMVQLMYYMQYLETVQRIFVFGESYENWIKTSLRPEIGCREGRRSPGSR